MTPEDIRKTPAATISDAAREQYFADGGVCIERAVDGDWLARVNAAVEALVERSREIEVSDKVFDLEPGHSAEEPQLRRVSSPCDQTRCSGSF